MKTLAAVISLAFIFMVANVFAAGSERFRLYGETADTKSMQTQKGDMINKKGHKKLHKMGRGGGGGPDREPEPDLM